MAKNLVIVESPAKVKTIKKFLGKNYEVMASNGHVRDLPKSSLGIDTQHHYEPKYITIRGKGELLASLRRQAKKADCIYLATDPDREGEAISWHLIEALHLEEGVYRRIAFNEITKTAVKESLKHPRDIDMDLVDAQQARRMLDRMVGYEISPLLWTKVKRGLSAGRVQSATLKMICDRENAILSFIPEEYYTLDVQLAVPGQKKPLTAHFQSLGGIRSQMNGTKERDRVLDAIAGAAYSVADITTNRREKKSPLPFTTSTLQQEASKTLNFPIQKTMRIAQQLYEGVDIRGEGTVGLITYLRTDSTRVSDEAREAAASFIRESYGEAYLGSGEKTARSAGRIQDAHEAIRPSDIRRLPTAIKESLSRDQFRLYQLIWKRFAASQMAGAQFENTTASIEAAGKDTARFTVSESLRVFDGYQLVYSVSDDEQEEKNALVEVLSAGMELSFAGQDVRQHFTQPPAHYTEASLVHVLEEHGIGRPSTYSPIVSTLLKRRYITKEGRNIFVTELGEIVNSIMCDSFPNIVDEKFTARMERRLDEVEEGETDWHDVLAEFYPGLAEDVKAAQESIDKVRVADEQTDVVCELCGRNMVIKYGPHGRFLACPGFPECRNTKPLLTEIGVDCPKCGKPLVERKTRKGRRFYGCSDPDCDFMSWSRPVAERCPKCGGYMTVRGQRVVCASQECGYSKKAETETENE